MAVRETVLPQRERARGRANALQREIGATSVEGIRAGRRWGCIGKLREAR